MIKITRWLKQNFFRTLMKNTATVLSGSMGGSLIGLLSFAIIVRHLGLNNYGMFVVLQTYIGIFDTLFNFQSWEAIIKFGSHSLVKNDRQKLKCYIKLGSIFDLSSALIGGLLALIFVTYIGGFLKWSDTQIFIAKVYSFAIFFNLTGTPRGVLRLFGKFKTIAFHRIIGSFTKLVLVILGYLLDLKFTQFCILLIIAEVLDYLILITFYLFVLREQKIASWYLSKVEDVGPFFKFGFWTNLSSMVSMPLVYLDKILIARFLSYDAVSVYKLLGQFAFIIRKILISIYSALYPELAKKIADNKAKESFKISAKLGVIILLLGFPVYLLFSLSSFFWLGPVFGKAFMPYNYLLLLYVGYKYLLASFVSVDSLFLSLGYVKAKLIIIVIAVAIYLSIVLVVGPLYGLIGFVLAEMIQEIFQVLSKISVIFHKYKKENRGSINAS